MGKSEEVTSSGLLVAGLPPITDSEAQRGVSLGAVPISPERKLELEKAGVLRDKNSQSDL